MRMTLSKRVIWSVGELINEKEINDLDVSVSEAGIDEADKGIFFLHYHISSRKNRRE